MNLKKKHFMIMTTNFVQQKSLTIDLNVGNNTMSSIQWKIDISLIQTLAEWMCVNKTDHSL